MLADFLDAHERHLVDANQLFRAACWANADHLYGLAAECGLKRLMIKFGMEIITSTGSPREDYDRVHANVAWKRFESYRAGRPAGAGYALGLNPFTDWDISQRYAHRSEFNEARAQRHKAGSDRVSALIQKARRDGLIP